MELRGSIVFLEGYFLAIAVYVTLTCLLSDPVNVVGYCVVGLSVTSGVLIYARHRLGFYLGLISTIVSLVVFAVAFSFSFKFRAGLGSLIYDGSLAFLSVLSIIAFLVVLDGRSLFRTAKYSQSQG